MPVVVPTWDSEHVILVLVSCLVAGSGVEVGAGEVSPELMSSSADRMTVSNRGRGKSVIWSFTPMM